jgi:hypothetical protein
VDKSSKYANYIVNRSPLRANQSQTLEEHWNKETKSKTFEDFWMCCSCLDFENQQEKA